jgi:PAN domain/Clp protease
MFKILVSVLALVWAVTIASAADVEVVEGQNGLPPIIVVKGQIFAGDQEKFDRIALQVEYADVFLFSQGGDVAAGLAIAKAIKLRSYQTWVMPNTICVSICSVIWLSGKKRFAYPTSLIGFHAAYNASDGSESGAATSEVGIHLFQLGLSPSAIRWLMSAGRDELRWLTPELALVFGIEVNYLTPKPAETPQTSLLPQQEQPPTLASKSYSIIENRDVYGFDLGEPTKAFSLEVCKNSCDSNASCAAFSFNKSKNLCYVKTGGQSVFWNENVTAGYVESIHSNLNFLRIVIISSTSLEGQSLLQTNNSDLEKCALSCNVDNRCTGFEFERKPSGTCSLKTGNLKKAKKLRITSGVKTAK